MRPGGEDGGPSALPAPRPVAQAGLLALSSLSLCVALPLLLCSSDALALLGLMNAFLLVFLFVVGNKVPVGWVALFGVIFG